MVIRVIAQVILMKMKKHVLQVMTLGFFSTFKTRMFILAKRPAKENIEKFLFAEYTLRGTQLFTYLFGETISKNIQENHAFWIDALASAFSGEFIFFVK
jgi:hypothetical protein